MAIYRKSYQQYQPPQQPQGELLSIKSWNAFDKTFMAFGSICNSMQKAERQDIEWAWNFAKQKVAELVEEIYQKDLPFEK